MNSPQKRSKKSSRATIRSGELVRSCISPWGDSRRPVGLCSVPPVARKRYSCNHGKRYGRQGTAAISPQVGGPNEKETPFGESASPCVPLGQRGSRIFRYALRGRRMGSITCRETSRAIQGVSEIDSGTPCSRKVGHFDSANSRTDCRCEKNCRCEIGWLPDPIAYLDCRRDSARS
jgi:hypothetical protein